MAWNTNPPLPGLSQLLPALQLVVSVGSQQLALEYQKSVKSYKKKAGQKAASQPRMVVEMMMMMMDCMNERIGDDLGTLIRQYCL